MGSGPLVSPQSSSLHLSQLPLGLFCPLASLYLPLHCLRCPCPSWELLPCPPGTIQDLPHQWLVAAGSRGEDLNFSRSCWGRGAQVDRRGFKAGAAEFSDTWTRAGKVGRGYRGYPDFWLRRVTHWAGDQKERLLVQGARAQVQHDLERARHKEARHVGMEVSKETGSETGSVGHRCRQPDAC